MDKNPGFPISGMGSSVRNSDDNLINLEVDNAHKGIRFAVNVEQYNASVLSYLHCKRLYYHHLMVR